jgi:hypothetical protein
MKAIEFDEQNTVFAKDQKEYNPLPAYVDNMVTCCMELSTSEIKRVAKFKKISITVMPFNRPVQSIALHIEKPLFPVPYRLKFNANPSKWDEDGTAKFSFNLEHDDVMELKKNKTIWVTTVTFGSPLQPISHLID